MPELVRVFDKDKACQRLWQGQSLSEALVRTELVRVFGKDRACQRPHGKDRAWQSLWQGQSFSEALGRTENVTDRGLSLMLPWSKFSNLVKTLPAAFYMMYPIYSKSCNWLCPWRATERNMNNLPFLSSKFSAMNFIFLGHELRWFIRLKHFKKMKSLLVILSVPSAQSGTDFHQTKTKKYSWKITLNEYFLKRLRYLTFSLKKTLNEYVLYKIHRY